MSPGRHKCPVDGCNISVGNQYLMCPKHWARVSKETQRRVYRATTKQQIAHGIQHASQEWHDASNRAIEEAAKGGV
jgi:hypothetical protein